MTSMPNATGLNRTTARGNAALLGAIATSTTPVIVLPRGVAGNNRARPGSAATPAAATSVELMRAASARRALVLAEMIAASIQAIASIARGAYARYRQRREMRATYNALCQLDDWTLRDIGFDRGELRSVAAEMTGTAELTRTRILAYSRR